MACWHKDEFNKTTHLFSHPHLRKGPVIVADVEQADSLWKQPTKDKKIMVNTRNTLSLEEYLSGNDGAKKSLHRFHFPASNRTAEM